MTTLAKSVALGALFAAAAAIAGLSYALPSQAEWGRLLLGIASFACFGFFLGGIYAFDPESELKIKSSSFGRVSFGLVSALLLAALWRWPLEGVFLSALLGAILGYLGMSWAKYVQF